MAASAPAERLFTEVADRYQRCFWLDGVAGRPWSSGPSVVGWLDDDDVSLSYDARSRTVTRHTGRRQEVVGRDIFAVLEAEVATSAPECLWVGYFGYACRADLPAQVGSPVPDAVWLRARQVRRFPHAQPRAIPTGGAPASAAEPLIDPADYGRAFERVQAEIRAGNTYQTNLTYRVELSSSIHPVAAYLRLRELNPAPYAGLLKHDVAGARSWLLSSSPERYASVDADRTLEARPIKGTTPRGPTAAEDLEHRERLLSDPKLRAENLMIVDLLRNDLSMVCQTGTVTVPDLMAVESYATVHQLVSTVRGTLREDVSTLGALRALFPAGSMTGAPKRSTMRIIDDVEASARGPYAGAFGWISPDGRADLGVVIRSLFTAGDSRWSLATGGGITIDSQCHDELAETRWKIAGLLPVLR